jgi:hypothetical protein
MAEQMADKSLEYQRTARRALEKDVYPAIGNKPVSEVTPGDVLAICDPTDQESGRSQNGPAYPAMSSSGCTSTPSPASL